MKYFGQNLVQIGFIIYPSENLFGQNHFLSWKMELKASLERLILKGMLPTLTDLPNIGLSTFHRTIILHLWIHFS